MLHHLSGIFFILNMDGYIKIFRQIKDWQHFQESSVLLVWLWLLVSVNFKDGYFHGKLVKKGEIITSFRKISEETGLSINTIRSCLDKLKMSGEISQKKSENSQISQYTHIVVNQFVKYQSVSMVDTPTDTLVDTLTDTPTDTLVDNNRRKKRNIRREEYILEIGEINPLAPSNKPTLEEREQNFYNEVAKFVGKYNREMLRAFFDYWSEPNKQKNKMRFELQRTWDTARRLSTWAKREENNFSNSKNNSNGNNQSNNRKNGLSDEEIREAVAGGFALYYGSKQQNNN